MKNTVFGLTVLDNEVSNFRAVYWLYREMMDDLATAIQCDELDDLDAHNLYVSSIQVHHLKNLEYSLTLHVRNREWSTLQCDLVWEHMVAVNSGVFCVNHYSGDLVDLTVKHPTATADDILSEYMITRSTTSDLNTVVDYLNAVLPTGIEDILDR